MEGDTFRKFSSCCKTARTVNAAIRVYKDTSIDSFSLLSNELIFSQMLHSWKAFSEKSVMTNIAALSAHAS
jgi:hypothetical protein